MKNFISELNPNEIVLSLYHPKVYHLYSKFRSILDIVIPKCGDESTIKLYKHLSDIETGLTPDGFKLKCQSLGFSDDLCKFLGSTYDKYCSLEDDDYRSLFLRIKNYLINEEIKYFVERYNEDHEVDTFIERVADLKVTDINVNFNDSKLFRTCMFGEIDPEAVMQSYEKGVLKSTFSMVNDSVPQGGYLPNSCVVFAAPTKCFTGDTQLIIPGEEPQTLESLYNQKRHDIPVYSIDPNGNYCETTAWFVRLSKYVKEIIEVTIGNSVIRCTPDHPFYTKENGIKLAKDLVLNEKLTTFCLENKEKVEQVNNIVIKQLDEEIPVYDVINAGIYHNYAIVTDFNTKTGTFVKNCGKSMLAMQETVNFLKQGAHVLYAAFGDLSEADLLSRMTAQINNRPIFYTSKNPASELKQAIKAVPQLKDNLCLEFLAPDKYTADDYVNYVKTAFAKDGVTKLHDWADVIIIDYDANLRTRFVDNMYKKGEDIYQTLYPLIYPNKLLIILAQTSKLAWDKEIVELGDLGESSRKAQIVDIN